jgi:8-oxo-dGTP pyrophosphatase MutT (NUDIX family)
MIRNVFDVHALFEQLREKLHAEPGRALSLPGLELREAAVLVPLFHRAGVPHILFTKRPMTLRSHAGQFSFPGGGREPSDVTPLHAALREAHEEVGIPPERVNVLGMLDESPTVTNFRIQPFVGVIPGDLTYRPNPREIELILEVPLETLLAPQSPRRELWRRGGREHEVYFFDYGPHVIWGATARILVELFAKASGLPAFEALKGARRCLCTR